MRFFALLAAIVVPIATFAPMYAADEDSVVVREAAPFPQVLDPPRAVESEATAFEVLRGDFHIHTTHSDGKLAPVERVVESWAAGYDVIAITDHGNFRAYEEVRNHADALGLILFRGMETGIAGQEHLVALDFSSDYEPRNPHNWAEQQGQSAVYYRDQMRRLEEAGGFVLYPHPHVGLRETMRWAIAEDLLKGIEVKNGVVGQGWNTVESHGTWWYPFALDWALEHHLAVFANSDIHGPRGNAQQPTTLVLAKERSAEGVREALEAGRTIAQFDGMLCAREELLALLIGNLVDVRVNGETETGRWLQIENRGPLTLEAAIEGIHPETATLGPFQTIVLRLDDAPDSLSIEWKNLWIRSTETLTTIHPLPWEQSAESQVHTPVRGSLVGT